MYKPQYGELWKHTEAKAHAGVENGKVMKVVIDEAGAGYATPPKVPVKGFEQAELVVTLQVDKARKKGGGIHSIELER